MCDEVAQYSDQIDVVKRNPLLMDQVKLNGKLYSKTECADIAK
jgi:hypothetical protein